MKAPRGTSNSNVRGNTRDREARRAFLLRKFGDGTTAPCYRCGVELDDSTVTVDRIIPGVDGGRYVQANIRPACAPCNAETGSILATRNRRKEHVCIDCRALPELQRPKAPRKIAEGCTPRRPRCATHFRAWKHGQRQAARVKRSQAQYGLAPGDREDLIELQDGKCPICGRGLDYDAKHRVWRQTHHDHDHELAAQHDHPDDKACPDCLRGLICSWCNRELLVRIDLEAARRLVAYYENPPMARLRASRQRMTCCGSPRECGSVACDEYVIADLEESA